MRLIDADNFMEFMGALKGAGAEQVSFDDLRKFINNQPTAYDVDKVVERLMCESINCHIMTDRAVEIVKSGSIQYPDSSSTDTENVTADWKEHLAGRFNRFE